MKCPACGLFDPPSAQLCDCGFDFVAKRVTTADGRPKRLPTGISDLVKGCWWFFGIAGGMAIPVVPFTIFMFDSPQAADHVTTRLAALAVASFPLVCLISIVLSGSFLRDCRMWPAIFFAVAPVGNALLFTVSMMTAGWKF
jgi:hypothetical protein